MRKDDVAILTDRYVRSLEWARRFIELGEYTKSIQDSYFAAFYAAKAALIHLGIRSKSHQSVQDRIDDLVEDGFLLSDIKRRARVVASETQRSSLPVCSGELDRAGSG